MARVCNFRQCSSRQCRGTAMHVVVFECNVHGQVLDANDVLHGARRPCVSRMLPAPAAVGQSHGRLRSALLSMDLSRNAMKVANVVSARTTPTTDKPSRFTPSKIPGLHASRIRQDSRPDRLRNSRSTRRRIHIGGTSFQIGTAHARSILQAGRHQYEPVRKTERASLFIQGEPPDRLLVILPRLAEAANR